MSPNHDVENKITTWITGDRLLTLSDHEYNKRFVFSKLIDFLNSKSTTICAIYGLRCTGKSVLMHQAIKSLIDSGVPTYKISYVELNKNTTYTDRDLIHTIRVLSNTVDYFFIDEISYIKLDIDNNSLNLLSDEFAIQGKKIVITGTSSYMLKLLSTDVLFDRMDRIDTTYFSFKEAHEILGLSIEDFVVYGGIIDSANRLTPDEYMKSAVTDNIINSLIRSEKIYEIGYTNKSIDNAIGDNDKLKSNLHKLINEIINSQLGIAGIPDISKECYDQFITILKQIGVIEDIFLQHSYESCFVTNYLGYNLRTDKEASDLKDLILKHTVYLDLKHSNKYTFDKYNGNGHGSKVDLIIIDNEVIHLYEIKYSEHTSYKQTISSSLISELEQVYNKKVASYNILYRGNTLAAEFNEQATQVNYINVEEFLCKL